MRPLHRKLKLILDKRPVSRENEINSFTFGLSVPINWRDIQSVTLKKVGGLFQEVEYHFKEGTEYIGQGHKRTLDEDEAELARVTLDLMLSDSLGLEVKFLDEGFSLYS